MAQNIPEQTIEDWTIIFGGDCALHRQGADEAEVELDRERGLYVRLHEGTGYMTQSCSHRIPLQVLFQLLTNAGYLISNGPYPIVPESGE